MHRAMAACAVLFCACAANSTDDGGDRSEASASDAGGGASGSSKPGGAGGSSGGSATGGRTGSGGIAAGTGGRAGAGGSVGTGGSSGTGGHTGTGGSPPPNPCIEAGTCPVGEWVNVTPAGISLDQQNPGGGDNYGVQDVLADPARPNELYSFVCYQGVWKSTDYGATWTQISSDAKPGKPWGEALDPNPNRNPSTAPVMFIGPSNAYGIFKSIDSGVTWTATALPAGFNQSVYSADIDPYDNQHVIVAFHEVPDVAESTDGGATWKKLPTPASDGGASYYPFFMNTGNAATTRKTWLTIPQQNGDARALRTTDGGATWIEIHQFQHHHGSAQIFDAGGGTIYIAAMSPYGVHKSTDYGATWTTLTTGVSGVVTASSKFFYASTGMGWGKVGSPLDPEVYTSPRGNDESWTKMTVPAGMVDGAKRIAVTSDGTHNIVVMGAWHAGIWRYIEP